MRMTTTTAQRMSNEADDNYDGDDDNDDDDDADDDDDETLSERCGTDVQLLWSGCDCHCDHERGSGGCNGSKEKHNYSFAQCQKSVRPAPKDQRIHP